MSGLIRKCGLILIMYTYLINLFGQEPDSGSSLFIIGLRAHYGFIIPHSSRIEPISHTNPRGIETDICWHLRSKNVWNYCYCYPRSGFSVYYADFANPDVLGSTVCIYSFVEPFIRIEERLNFSIRFGIGPSIMTKVYDRDSNPENLMFGSTLSFIALLNFSMNYRMNDRITLRLAGNYNHISNGGWKEPNYGCNFPTLNTGLDFSFTPATFEDREKNPDIILNPKKNRFDLSYLLSGKPIAHGRDRKYIVYGLGIQYSRVAGRILALTAGSEWVNDGSVKKEVRLFEMVDESGRYIDHNRVSMLAGVEWLFGRFIFSQQMGVYVYAPCKAKNFLYQRYGLSFKATDHIYTGINIKAHGDDADFLDMRVGVFLSK